jgi:hypothetical protein
MVSTPATSIATSTPAMPAAISTAVTKSASRPAVPNAKVKNNTPIQTSKSQTSATSQKSQRPSPLAANKANMSPASEAGKSRLKMETFELGDEGKVLLKLSNAITAPVGIKTPEETQALAQATAVWRAINGQPAVDDKLVAAVAENDKKQKAIEAKAAASIKLANQKLAETTEFYSLLVYGLLGILAIALACLALFWLKMRQKARTEFNWLNDAGEDKQDETATHEPTQFLPTALGEVAPDETTLTEPVLEHQPHEEVTANSTLADSPLASLLSNTKVIKKKSKSSTDAPSDLSFETMSTQVPAKELSIDERPDQFTEERFDERVSKSKKKNRNTVEHNPIMPVAETIDFDMTDMTTKPHVSASAPKMSSTKEDVKSNLIDFDIFADPPAAEKP